MPTDVKTYDPALVQVTIGGAIITGYEPGTFIQIVRTVNNFDFTVSPDGKEGVRTKRNDRSALFTFTLRQTAEDNLVLSNLANRDEAQSDGVVPIQVIDLANNGETIYEAAKAWIEKPADATFAETAQGRPWQIRIAELPMRTAGTPTTAALTATLT